MARVASRRKPGRPPLPPGEGKKVPLNMRTTQAVRDRLEAAAGRSGRSLVHEVEYRLDQTFKDEDALGGWQFRAMFSLFGNAAVLIEQQTGKSCFEDWNTWVAVQRAWGRLGVRFGPLPSKAWRKALLEASKATTSTFLEPPPEDAEPGVRAAYLIEASKGIQAISAFHRYQEDDRVQEAFGEEIAVMLLPKKPE